MTSVTNEASLRLAERFAGHLVEIQSVGHTSGWIIIPEARHGAVVRTGDRRAGVCLFHVESIPDMPGVVSFRVQDTNLYLTNIMYGDEHRQAVANALASVPGILADNIAAVVDYSVGRPTDEKNFEGAGFNYSEMTVLEGPPNKLQMFQLVTGIGVRSLFGTYWRSQWWDRVVSQSPHLLGDETWRVLEVLEESQPDV